MCYSTIPSNVRGCQSGTRGLLDRKKIRGTSTVTKLQGENQGKHDKNKNKNKKNTRDVGTVGYRDAQGTGVCDICTPKDMENGTVESSWPTRRLL